MRETGIAERNHWVYGFGELVNTFGKKRTEDFARAMKKAGYFSIELEMNDGSTITIDLPEEKSAKKEAPLFADKRA